MKRFFTMIGFALAFLPLSADAALLPTPPCAPQQFGCGGASANLAYNVIAGGIVPLLLQVAAGLAVLYIVWAGVQMIISMGDEGKVSQFKWGVANALLGLMVAILSEFVVAAIGTQNYGQGAVGSNGNLPLNLITTGITILRLLLNGLFVLVAVVAGIRMVYSQGKSDDYNKGKTMLQWALIGAIIVNLAATLANALSSYFNV
jgi:hypothetical protein